MAIVRAIPGRERDPVRVAALRGKSCRESEAEFAACLTGTWREEHLFNLESSLRLYNAVRERVTAYKARLLEEIRALETEERHERPPPHGGGVAPALPHRLGGHLVKRSAASTWALLRFRPRTLPAEKSSEFQASIVRAVPRYRFQGLVGREIVDRLIIGRTKSRLPMADSIL